MEAPVFELVKTTFAIRGISESVGENYLFVDDEPLTNLVESQAIRNHSPDGPGWGYGGSGPAQAALMICLHIFKNKHVVQTLYQDFKREYVANWGKNGESFDVVIDVADFLIEHRADLKKAAQLEQWEQEDAEWMNLPDEESR